MIATAKKQSAFDKWLDTFLEEKGIDLEESFEVRGAGGTNIMTYGVVVEHMKIAPTHEQKQIKNMLVKIDFQHGDVKHYLRHLASALAK
jgi:cation transport regulator ChaC